MNRRGRRHWDIRGAVLRWFDDESAQELAEYAWLAFWVGLSGLLVWAAVVVLLGDRYTDYIGDADPNNITGVQQLWDQPPPP
jgi:hypothetical protein